MRLVSDRSPSSGFREPCEAQVRQPQPIREAVRLSRDTAIPLCGYQFPMPSQNRIWTCDSGHLFEQFPPENFAFHGQTPTLVIVEQNAFLTKLFSEHIIFGAKILNYLLLSMVYPTSRDQEQQLPGF